MLTRDLDFLKHKYRELLLPTLLMLLSDKICLIADAVLIGYFFEDSSFLSAINMASPYIYFSAVLYTLFGVGGSLLALRAKADQMMKRPTSTLPQPLWVYYWQMQSI